MATGAEANSVIIKTLPSTITNKGVSQSAKEQHQWSPYNVNEGTACAVAGTDFCIVAGDTRMSDGYTILSRDVAKIHQLTNKCVISIAGMQAEASTLSKILNIRIQQYRNRHNIEISTTAIAQLLSNTLYYKRFFPYYTFNVLGGVDNDGKGAVFGYDAIGSFERMPYCVTGSASALITSILDNQVAFKTQKKNEKNLTVEETIDLVKDVFTCAGERDIYTGDSVDIAIITKDGIKIERFELKKD
jgi:20S proteasome subunit beta 6